MNSRPVLGLDIDGTIAAYHEHYLAFVEAWLGKPVPRKYDGSVPLHTWCGISKATYRESKRAYRMGGAKRSMPTLAPPLPDAARLTHTVAKWGVDVYLCTTRPYLAHDNIDPDTRHWVRRNGVRCRGVIWGEHKYRDLVRMVGKGRVFAVVDDLPTMCDQAASLNVPTVFALRDHNLNDAPTYMHLSARTEDETLAVLRALLQDWRGK